MSNVIAFKKPAAKPKGMCQHGFHRWKIVQKQGFDVHEGKLITRYQCERCGETKIKAL